MQYSTLIDAAALAQLIRDPAVAVIDCRFDLAQTAAGREAYLAAHIPGARYAGLDDALSAAAGPGTGRHPLPSPQTFARCAGALGIGDATQVIAYDQANGAFAARLWWMLRWLGHTRVAVLDGGFAAWIAAGGPVQSGTETAARRTFTPKLDAQCSVTSAQVVEALGEPGRVLVDARAAERYSGAFEPLDRVAGHVPGARNYPFSLNLGADGRFLAPAALRRRWLEFLQGAPPNGAIAMCGSGVTACHNLLALEVAGLPGAKLYAGSFSEWIQDPRRRVASGDAP